MLRLNSSLIKGDGFKQNILDSLCVLAGSWNQLGLRSHQRFVSFFFFSFFFSILSGLLKQWANIPSPCCQPDILGISPSPWWRTPPCCGCFGFPGPGTAPGPYQHPTSELRSGGAKPPQATRVPFEGWSARGAKPEMFFFFHPA